MLFISNPGNDLFKKFSEASQTLLSIKDAEFAYAYVDDFGTEIGHLRGLMALPEFMEN